MFLEIRDYDYAKLAEIFYDDGDHTMRFTAHKLNLPLPLVEWMIDDAKKRLVPLSKIDD